MRKKIIDNSYGNSLMQHISEVLPKQIDVITGYASFRGLISLSSNLEGCPVKVYVGDDSIIGKNYCSRSGFKLDQVMHIGDLRNHLTGLNNISFNDNLKLFSMANELDINPQMMHGKVYKVLCSNDESCYYVGSGNFTSTGLGINEHKIPYECFLRIKSEDDIDFWFKNTLKSYKVRELTSFRDEIKSHYFISEKDFVHQFVHLSNGVEKLSLAFEDALKCYVEECEYYNLLKDNQKNAFNQIARNLHGHNGSMLSFSVGLGKTIVGALIFDFFKNYLNFNVKIITPKNLKSNWESYGNGKKIINDKMVKIDNLSEGSVLSVSEIADDHFFRAVSDANLIIIDESHMFKDSKSQRYKRLVGAMKNGSKFKSKKVLLITATPFNNEPSDLVNQIKLLGNSKFEDSKNNKLIEVYRKKDLLAEAWSKKAQFDKIPTGDFKIFTDNFIHTSTKLSKDGPINGFPKVKVTNHRYFTDNRSKKILDEMIDILYPENDNFILYPDTDALVKVQFINCLSSSVDAFVMTLENFWSKKTETYLSVKEYGFNIDNTKVQVLIDNYSKSDSRKNESEKQVRRKRIIEHLKDFCEIKSNKNKIDRLIELANRLNSSDENCSCKDSKLIEAMAEVLEKKHKFICFTTHKVTIKHLRNLIFNSEELSKGTYIFVNSSETEFEIIKNGKIFTDITINSLDEVKGLFSPTYNSYDKNSCSEIGNIDGLFTTDILSEGHDLQDANTVFNYDIHWNPVKLIQRVGRVYRLRNKAQATSEMFEKIYVHNFFFDSEKLKEKLRKEEKVYGKAKYIEALEGEAYLYMHDYDDDKAAWEEYLEKNHKINFEKKYYISEKDIYESVGSNLFSSHDLLLKNQFAETAKLITSERNIETRVKQIYRGAFALSYNKMLKKGIYFSGVITERRNGDRHKVDRLDFNDKHLPHFIIGINNGEIFEVEETLEMFAWNYESLKEEVHPEPSTIILSSDDIDRIVEYFNKKKKNKIKKVLIEDIEIFSIMEVKHE